MESGHPCSSASRSNSSCTQNRFPSSCSDAAIHSERDHHHHHSSNADHQIPDLIHQVRDQPSRNQYVRHRVRLEPARLRMLVREKVEELGVSLSKYPYTQSGGGDPRPHLSTLAATIADQIHTEYQDVIKQLEDLRLAEWSDHNPPAPSRPTATTTSAAAGASAQPPVDVQVLHPEPPDYVNLTPVRNPFAADLGSPIYQPGAYAPSSCLVDTVDEIYDFPGKYRTQMKSQQAKMFMTPQGWLQMAKKFIGKSKNGESGTSADLSQNGGKKSPRGGASGGATAKPNPSRSISLYNANSVHGGAGANSVVDRYGSSGFLSRWTNGGGASTSSTVTSPSSSEPPPPPPMPFMLSSGNVGRYSSRYYNRSESDLLSAGVGSYPIASSYLPHDTFYYAQEPPSFSRYPDGGSILHRDPGRSAFQVYTVGGSSGSSQQTQPLFGSTFQQHNNDGRSSPEIQIFGNEVQYRSAASTDRVSSI